MGGYQLSFPFWRTFPRFPSLHRKFGDERCHMNMDMIPWQPPRPLCIFDVSLYWAQQCGAMLCCNAMPGEGGGHVSAKRLSDAWRLQQNRWNR